MQLPFCVSRMTTYLPQLSLCGTQFAVHIGRVPADQWVWYASRYARSRSISAGERLLEVLLDSWSVLEHIPDRDLL
jgi:hypothetical protein